MTQRKCNYCRYDDNSAYKKACEGCVDASHFAPESSGAEYAELRDKIAIAAMQSVLTHQSITTVSVVDLAEAAYVLADTMLADTMLAVRSTKNA